MSPTRRSLEYMRNLGYVCEVVERWNAHTKTRKDLLGFGDVIAIGNGNIILVQVTSGTNVAARITKIREQCSESAKAWLDAGGQIEIHGWRQVATCKKDGSKAKRKKWLPRLEALTVGDL
jgi:hypothetical protein